MLKIYKKLSDEEVGHLNLDEAILKYIKCKYGVYLYTDINQGFDNETCPVTVNVLNVLKDTGFAIGSYELRQAFKELDEINITVQGPKINYSGLLTYLEAKFQTFKQEL